MFNKSQAEYFVDSSTFYNSKNNAVPTSGPITVYRWF